MKLIDFSKKKTYSLKMGKSIYSYVEKPCAHWVHIYVQRDAAKKRENLKTGSS